ncbi:helix-turn-helix domain-containing protein [Pleomorphomonas koreensis]|uniref:helix-turn-helix domain-containing protein n=1 Tax=Pleomorphomonas koreensis TaxID=257440 RepID=UPI00040DA148|nr:helix-turn-helix transcriptional regulator [Pleomorphomonas koreensis]
MSKTDVQDDYLREFRLWMNHHMARQKLTLNQLAKATNIGVATVYRLLDEANPSVPSLPTVYALERQFQDKAPIYGGDVEYFSKDEAIPVPEENTQHFKLIDGLGLWKITSDALNVLGIRKGDFMVVDMNRKPEHDQIALAEVRDWDRAEPYMIFRRYSANPLPMLLSSSTCVDIPNEHLLDGRGVTIVGVVVGSYKPLATI